MAVQVSRPQKRQQQDSMASDLSTIGTVAGTIIGGMTAGPGGATAGAAAGAGLGSQIGGMVGNIAAPKQEEKQFTPSVEASALDRRMQNLDSSNISQLRNSINSLQYVEDPKMRVALAKPLLKGLYVAETRES